MRLWGVGRGVISGLLSVALCGVARGDFPSVNARAFQPPTDPEGSLFLEPTSTPGPGAFNTAAWLTYGFRPAVLRDANGDKLTNLVSHQLSADFLANLGIGQRFALGLDVPMVVYQQGPDNATTRAVAGGPPPRSRSEIWPWSAKRTCSRPGPSAGLAWRRCCALRLPPATPVRTSVTAPRPVNYVCWPNTASSRSPCKPRAVFG